MIQPSLLSRWIYENGDIWQFHLQKPSGFISFAKDRAVDFWEDQIIYLWQLGWVRADIVQGKLNPKPEGFEILEKNNEEGSIYADIRHLGSVQLQTEVPSIELIRKNSDVIPYFHPFRLYVFWEIYRIIKLRINPYQMFIPGRYHEILDFEINSFYQWVQSENAKVLINRWDEITCLAIATEPCFYPQIFGSVKYPPQISYNEQMANIYSHKMQLKEHYMQIGIEPLKEIINELCVSAEMIEPNKKIQSLMRFMNGNQRLKIKGHLGGAILFKAMAETIRLMTEWSFAIQLPEEDEMGFGMWVKGARESLYGSKRIFDAKSVLSKRQFLREMGLDTGVRVRFYVEGPTEYAAFSYLFNPWQQIEVIDLAGQFIQGKKKGLAFRENLILDNRSGIFSIIILDGDREDNIRNVRKAAEDDVFCGQFFIFFPDFEFQNFSIDELIEIAWESVDKIDKSRQLFQLLQQEINSAANADDFIKVVRRTVPSLSQLVKGHDWGEKLAEYAARKPEVDKRKEIRPFIETYQTAIQFINIDYHFNRTNYRVDSNTGKLVHR